MDRKTIILVALCVLLLVFWGQILEYVGLVDPPSEQPATRPLVTDSVATITPSQAVPGETPAAAQQPAAQPESKPSITEIDSLIPERLFTITTPLYELTFSNYGGGLKNIMLRRHVYNGGGGVIMADGSGGVVPDFTALNGAFMAGRLVFESNQSSLEISEGSEPQKITFTHDNGRGGRIIKTYTVKPDRYDIDFDLTIDGIESFGFERSYNLIWGATPPPTQKDAKDDFGYFKVVAYLDGQEEFDDYDNNVMNEIVTGNTAWAGLRTKYFASVMIPQTRPASGLVATGTKYNIRVGSDAVEARKLQASLEMPLSNYGSVSDSYILYVGPIDYNILKEYENGLEELTSLGFIIIKPFSIAIIWLLPKIYSVIPNYGIVVLLFAFLIKLITYPLTRKQNLAMAKMKDLQPKMKGLQEKFKQDPGRLNKEMMKLYKEAGANPLSGCLPILPQMPLFFALFTVFRTTIEFRGASFVGWITDLSIPDPYFVLPVLMVVVMFIQQKMTITDPKQKMMVYIFPLFFGWISLNFPAGLVLYWTGFSLLSFLEMMYIRKKNIPVTVIEEKK